MKIAKRAVRPRVIFRASLRYSPAVREASALHMPRFRPKADIPKTDPFPSSGADCYRYVFEPRGRQ
jgi:hypothetical protein